MRRIVLMLSISLDNYMKNPNRNLNQHLMDDELHDHFNEMLAAMGAFLNDQITYELMAEFQPTADSDPQSPRPMSEFAQI